jgi:hypothetical protein
LVLLGGHTEPGLVISKVAIEEAQLGDDPAALVGEQWKCDALARCEFAQHARRIVADADQADPAPLELVLNCLQLN